MIPEANGSTRHGRSHDDETLTASDEGVTNGLQRAGGARGRADVDGRDANHGCKSATR